MREYSDSPSKFQSDRSRGSLSPQDFGSPMANREEAVPTPTRMHSGEYELLVRKAGRFGRKLFFSIPVGGLRVKQPFGGQQSHEKSNATGGVALRWRRCLGQLPSTQPFSAVRH